jgi:hypothetical protein
MFDGQPLAWGKEPTVTPAFNGFVESLVRVLSNQCGSQRLVPAAHANEPQIHSQSRFAFSVIELVG